MSEADRLAEAEREAADAHLAAAQTLALHDEANAQLQAKAEAAEAELATAKGVSAASLRAAELLEAERDALKEALANEVADSKRWQTENNALAAELADLQSRWDAVVAERDAALAELARKDTEVNQWLRERDKVEAELAEWKDRSHRVSTQHGRVLAERDAALERARTLEAENTNQHHNLYAIYGTAVRWYKRGRAAEERAVAAEADADQLAELLEPPGPGVEVVRGADDALAAHREAVAARPKEAGE